MATNAPQQPLYRSRAPIRVDLAGGWTDVPPFSTEEGGAVVNATINRYTYATLVPSDDERIEINSADFYQFLTVRSFRDLEYDGNLDLIKAAMIAVQLWLDSEKLASRLLLQVHDELILEVPADELTVVQKELPQRMCTVGRLRVPLVVDVGVGVNWDQAH